MEDADQCQYTSLRNVQRLSVPSTSFQAKSKCIEMEFSTPEVLDSFNDDESDVEFSILSSNNKENIENQETLSHETKMLKCSKTINKKIDYSLTEKSPKTQFKGIYCLYVCLFEKMLSYWRLQCKCNF